ncbi:MAG: hypothetical protein Sapg2KO_36600 [Saprospiraceae bacterium]
MKFMNKIRIIGIVMLVIGIVLQFFLKSDGADFFTGFFGTGGIILLLTGRIKFKKQT